MAGFNTKDIGDFFRANELQSYRFNVDSTIQRVFDKLDNVLEQVKPLLKLISSYEASENETFWETFNDLTGKNYDPALLGTPYMHWFSTFAQCGAAQDKTKEANLFVEIFSDDKDGARHPLLYVKLMAYKHPSGKVLFQIKGLSANDGGALQSVLETLLDRVHHGGAFHFSENPRGPKVVDPLCVTLTEYFYHEKHGMQSREIHLQKSRLGTMRNDMYENLNVEAMCQAFIDSDESLLVLSGPPGTGKTTVIKMLVMEMWKHFNQEAIESGTDDGDDYVDVTALYVKDTQVLSRPEFWTGLNLDENGYDLLIFDDVDIVLQNRVKKDGERGDFSQIVNQLLSLSSGFVKHDVKILVTTNLPIDNIDPAIIRPGRCFDVIEMPQMSVSHAKKLWLEAFELEDKDFPFAGLEATASVTQASLMSEVTRVKKEQPEYYLNGANYSVREKR